MSGSGGSKRPDRVDRALAGGGLSLMVNEIFGPTVQGEGLSIGVPAVFLRVAGCPLSCSWCDTAYSWDWSRFSRAENARPMKVGTAWRHALDLASGTQVRTLVITGGEPAAQWRPLSAVARLARDAGWRVEVETSGALDLHELAECSDVITISPKLAGARMGRGARINDDLLRKYSQCDRVVWKFVIDPTDDIEEVDELVRRHGLSPVFLMPQATTPEQVIDRTRQLIPAAIERGYRVAPRLHTLLWADERGR